jgi:hypothetical protein
MRYIITNHADERIQQRKIPPSYVDKTLNSPDQKITSDDGTTKYRKRFGIYTTTAVVKMNDNYENVVISFWIDPPTFGSMDHKKQENYKNMKKAGSLKRILITMKRQIGF